jgi:hypothetical protein
VTLGDFRSAIADRPDLLRKYRDAESICVSVVVPDALRLLVPPE